MGTTKGSKEEKSTITDLVLVKDVDAVDVTSVIKKLEDAIKKLKHIEETPWKTEGVVEGFPGLSIKTETLIPNLIRMHSSIFGRADAYNKSQEILGVTAPPFTVSGFSPEAFEADIKLRIEIIEQKEKLDVLKGFKAEMQQFITEKDKKNILFGKMAAFFDGAAAE